PAGAEKVRVRTSSRVPGGRVSIQVCANVVCVSRLPGCLVSIAETRSPRAWAGAVAVRAPALTRLTCGGSVAVTRLVLPVSWTRAVTPLWLLEVLVSVSVTRG